MKWLLPPRGANRVVGKGSSEPMARTVMKHLIHAVPILMLCGCASLRPGALSDLVDGTPEDTTVTEVDRDLGADGRDASLLSAFFGLDSALPRGLNYFSGEKFEGRDGMPVVFSHELDFSTLQAGDFSITTESGKVGQPAFVTLAPADDVGEWRTVLLVGEYGSIEDQPVQVEIVGNLLSDDRSVNFKGKTVGVVRLEEGPSMALAQVAPENEWRTGQRATLGPGGGSGCDPETVQAIRITWEGGVTKPGGKEVDDRERLLYKVVVLNRDGSATEVTPFAIADLKDGDNNHLLCLDVEGTPQSVFFPAGHVTDPREDLNPETRIEVTGENAVGRRRR